MLKCPLCGDPFDNTRGVVSHMAQKDDHSPNNFKQAREALMRANSSVPEIAESQAGGGEGTTGPRDRWDEQEQIADDPAMAVPDVSKPGRGTDCPECGTEMNRAPVGGRYVGELDGSEVEVRTSGGDMICPECEAIKTNNGKLIA